MKKSTTIKSLAAGLFFSAVLLQITVNNGFSLAPAGKKVQLKVCYNPDGTWAGSGAVCITGSGSCIANPCK